MKQAWNAEESETTEVTEMLRFVHHCERYEVEGRNLNEKVRGREEWLHVGMN